MAGNYSFRGVDFDNVFLQDYKVLDEFVGAGSLWTWGFNDAGQLGDNTITRKSSPVQTVAGGTNWRISSGMSGGNTCGAIKSDGTLWTWGANNSGQLGDNTITKKSSPVQTVAGGTNWSVISTDGVAFGAIKTDGTLWTWGIGGFGTLGDNAGTNRSSPAQTTSATNDWKFVCVGGQAMHAIKTDGTLWAWGYNGYGHQGTNTGITNNFSPVQIGSLLWSTVCTGKTGAAAIRSDGTLWLWGSNSYGNLGTGNTTNRSSPVQTIAGGTNWKQVQVGKHSAGAIKNDGTLWVWGRNDYGNIGDNTTTHRSSPVQTISGGTNWKEISIKDTQCGAIKTDGTLWMWGFNGQGQLGTNDTTNRSSPVQTVAAGTNWKSVNSGLAATGIYFFDSLDSYPTA